MDRKYIQTLVRMLLVTAALVSVSCTKEKETQRRAINEAVITGIDSVYAIRPDSLLRIAPEVTFTRDTAADTAHYTFEWIKLNQVGVYPYNPEVISSQPVLSYTFDWFLGACRMALRVRDKRTNLFTESFFTLLITNDVYEGWLLLNDTGNGSRLDMLSYQAEADTFRTMIDVLALRSQVTLGPDPGFVTHAYLRAPRKERGAIVIGSGEDVIALDKDNLDNPASFRWLINGSQLRGNSSTLFPFNYWTFLWADGDIYVGEEDLNLCTYMRDAEGRNHRFKAAPFIAGYPFLARQPTVLYNQDEREFVWFALGLNYCHRFGKGSLFDYKTGKELVYLTFTFYEGGQYIALLRDHTDGKIYLARFTTARQLDYHELQLPGIAAAEHFAVSAKRGTLFYSNGGHTPDFHSVPSPDGRSFLSHYPNPR